MMTPFRINSTTVLALVLTLVIALSSCKSAKKAAEAQRAADEKARIEQEASMKKQQQAQEEEQRKQAAADQAARDAEARQQQQAKESTPYVKLTQYFDAISSAATLASANNSINEALGMFSSPETPVLIIISGSGDQKDYDKPTTIKAYLNYLKDQKKSINKIEHLDMDDSGKITAVELKKN